MRTIIIGELMQQDLQSILSFEEQKELSIGLLREWWITATQALVDEVGSEKALEHLRPYFQHAGKAGRHAYIDITGLNCGDPEIASLEAGYALATATGGTFASAYKAVDGSGIGELRDCMTTGRCKEACMSSCSYVASSSLEELNPDYELILTRSLSFGDGFCQWLFKHKGVSALVEEDDLFRVEPSKAFQDPLNADLNHYLGLAYCGEFWVIATRVFLDVMGPDKVVRSLNCHMHNSGISLGKRISDRTRSEEKREDVILDTIQLISTLHQRKGDIDLDQRTDEGTVKECPFSSSPPEMCTQYEAFFNGICEAIDPTYEFAYDKMMTKGDKTCHWVVRKKKEMPKASPKEETPSNDPAKMLAMRFAKGELTEEEFRKKLAVLKELKF